MSMILMWENVTEPTLVEDSKIHNCLAGFDLVGYRHSDGKLYTENEKKDLVSPEYLFDEWPDSISVYGNTYNLERVEESLNNYEIAIYC